MCRFLKTAEALQVKGLAQHPFLSPPSGTEEEEDMEDVQEEEDEVEEEEEPNGHTPRPAWVQEKSTFKQVGYIHHSFPLSFFGL